MSRVKGEGEMANLAFFRGERRNAPNEMTIDELLAKKGDYGFLEREHSFIQWLFPVMANTGVNGYAVKLGRAEARAMRGDLTVARRVVAGYRMMLDFYGLELADEQTGEVKRAAHYAERYEHLNYSSHNYLRMSRILFSLGELGFRTYKAPLVAHWEREIVDNKLVTNAKHSFEMFWKFTLEEDSEAYARHTMEIASDLEPSVFFADEKDEKAAEADERVEDERPAKKGRKDEL